MILKYLKRKYVHYGTGIWMMAHKCLRECGSTYSASMLRRVLVDTRSGFGAKAPSRMYDIYAARIIAAIGKYLGTWVLAPIGVGVCRLEHCRDRVCHHVTWALKHLLPKQGYMQALKALLEEG